MEFRDRFVVDDPDSIYLDGNSLGRLPLATRDRLAALVEQWGTRLVSAWEEWIDLPIQVGDRLATGVLGAGPGEVVVCDSTTVNLYKLVRALMAHRPGALVTDRANFPTDRYVLEGIAGAERELRQFESDPVDGPSAEDVARAVAPGDVALLVLSHVAYRSGAVADMAAIEAVAGGAGVPVVWDLSHSVGSVPTELHARGVRYAVGCTYKHLNAGPGAPAFLYVRADEQEALTSPIQGWFGQAEQFDMERPYAPAPGIARFLAGTPSILGLVAVDEGVKLTTEAGMEAVAARSASLTSLIVDFLDEHLGPLGFALGSPRDAGRRGAQVALRHPDAWPICRALIERARVIPDFRGPDVVRLGVAPLYTTDAELRDALERLRDLVARGEHERIDATRSRVT